MDYSAMIQSRKSVREFQDTKVSDATLAEIKKYYDEACGRLVPAIGTELRLFGADSREKLKGAAGYNDFIIGNADYFAILSDEAEYMSENAGFIAEEIVLRITELDLGACWLSFKDGEAVKSALGIESDRRVAALVAFGLEKKAAKRVFLNIQNISKVDAVKREFYSPRLGIESLVFSGKWGNKDGVDEEIGDMDHPLWQALYAASLAPSYLNRQPYGFVLDGGTVVLISKEDAYTDENEQKLNLGIVMLHFAAVAGQTLGKRVWTMGAYEKELGLPSGCRAVAFCKL